VSIAAVVLAAGASRRLGRPKQLVEIGGETLLARAIRVAGEAGLQPVLVVIADPALAPPAHAAGAAVAMNLDAGEGIASSIRAGIASLQSSAASGAVLMTCDQVAMNAQHLRALCEHPESTAASAYAGVLGVPAYFPATRFPDLLQLQGDRGARDLLREARAIPTEALALDLDTEEDVALARKVLEEQGLA
jgi:CTP:molybdopterin cytidylyltransferase MocA